MSKFESSVVIPVYNKWELTRKCLKSLASNIDKSRVEIIIIDNGSTDATEKGCFFLGKQLFGDSFQYIRNNVNRNFAGASNQGADAAHGEFIIFLNNDTEVQPHWYEPLLQDFKDYPDIAATGPILVYPEMTPFGRLIQHLGLFLSPFYSIGHLYQGIPYASQLVRKRRFFQAITAACFVIKRELFLGVGGFDEKFINGLEDVDLCFRLFENGYRLTVNPDSLVIHHESQSQGRHDYDSENSIYLREKSLVLMNPDWHLLIKEDGFHLNAEWAMLFCAMDSDLEEKLNAQISSLTDEKIKEMLIDNPYWVDGWYEFLSRNQINSEQKGLFEIYTKLFSKPEHIFNLSHLPWVINDKALLLRCYNSLKPYLKNQQEYYKTAFDSMKFCSLQKNSEIVDTFASFIQTYDDFCKNKFQLLISELDTIKSKL